MGDGLGCPSKPLAILMRSVLQGDSGGPLVCGGVAEGVVTAGSRVCGNYKKPAIYTRIAPYAAWIDSVMASADGEGDTR